MQAVVRGALAAVLAVAVLAGGRSALAQEPAYGGAAAELAEQIAAAFPKVSGQIIGLERERILLDLSAKDKIIPGLELQVYRPGQEFKHPYTGQSLGKLDRDVGRVRVIEVHGGFSVAEVIQQTEGTMVQQGDLVRVTSARVILALPNVDVSDVAGANTRSVTRDLVNALVKTNRFEVMTDQRLRAAVAEEKIQVGDQFNDPAVLQALWKRLRVSAVLLAKLTLLEKAVQWDVQLVSTVRGDSIMLASAEVKGMTPRAGASASRAGTASLLGRDAPRIDQIALRSQEIPFKAIALAAGDLTGDGTTKLAITDGQGLYIYDLDKNGIKLLWSAPGIPTDNILSVDAADINGNGVPEIFVTNYSRNQARSYVLEYQKGKFTRVSEEIPLHFRVLEGPAGTPQLYGQAAGNDRPFDGPVRRYHWQGNRYVPAEAVALPRPFN
ncbi:MAG: FG-GAP-like repeat-containing protein, partial [Candidatus Methylomirabilales bacterium]